MLRPASIACVLATLLLGACSDPPTSPSAARAAASGNTEAKPGGGTPTPSPHTLSFEAPVADNDGYPSPGHVSGSGPVSGWITGPNASGYFKASAVGAFTMTLTDVDKLPEDAAGGNPCTEDEQTYLRGIGLLGPSTAVTGSLSLTIDEDTTGSVTGPTLAWELGGIQVASQPGYTWKIVGGSGSTNPLFKPFFDPSSTTSHLALTLENGRAHFYRYPNGGRKPSADQFIACRVDFTMVMTKP